MSAGAKAVENEIALKNEVEELVREVLENKVDKISQNVTFGTTIWGAKRTIDVLLKLKDGKQLAIECMYQGSSGTADQKFFAKLEDNKKLPFPTLIVIDGEGFRDNMAAIMKSHGAVDMKELKQWLKVTFGMW